MFRPETELLTSEGFIPFHQVDNDHYVATFSAETAHFIGFHLPDYVIVDDRQDTLLTLNGRLALSISPRTQLYVSQSKSNATRCNPTFSIRPAIELSQGCNLLFDTPIRLRHAGATRNSSEALTDQEMFAFGQLIGFFIGDGHAASTNQIVFNLVKPRKQDYLINIAQHLPYHLKISGTRFVLQYPLLGERWRQWFYSEDGYKRIHPMLFAGTVPYYLGIMNGLMESDGYVRETRQGWVYTTTSRYLIADIQAIGAILGEPFSVTQPIPSTYRLYTLRRKAYPHLNDSRTNLTFDLIPNGDLLYNVVMPNQLICIRQATTTWLVGAAVQTDGCQIVY